MISPGVKVGKYEVKRLLGQGGFGMVFLVHDTKLDRECAMKFLLPEHTARPEILQRFLKEARSAAKIKHAGIVTVFECDVIEGAGPGLDGMAYIAMELLEGEALSDRLRRGPMPIDQAIEISRQVASALSAAHAVNIIHRDLKPDNIFLVPDPATTLGERVKVLDFGIAKLADPSETTGAKTSTHMIFGTPKYMSPEQCKSSAKVDERSDIYALGCILFEMVCGRAPFEGDAGELIAMQQLTVPPDAKTLRPDLPATLEAAISSMLAKQPTLRPSTMTDVVRQLGATVTAGMAAMTPMASSSRLEPAPTVAPDQPTYPPPVFAPSTPPPMTPASITPASITPASITPASITPSAPLSPAPVFPTSPPQGIERVAPTVAVATSRGSDVAGPRIEPKKRSMMPFVALGGLAIVGGTVAIIALGGGNGSKVVSDAGSAVAMVPTETATRYLETLYESFRKHTNGPCKDQQAELAESRAKSPLVADVLEAVYGPCTDGPWKQPTPDETKTYALPLGRAPVVGDADAKVTMVVGYDYGDPVARRWLPVVSELRTRYGHDLRIVYKPLLLGFHHATASSVAACAAAKQGKFEAFAGLLWEAFDKKTFDVEKAGEPWCWRTPEHCPVVLAMAGKAGLDVPRFKTEMDGCVEEVAADVRDWHRLRMVAPRSFLINGRYLVGGAERLGKLIDEELAKANQRITEGSKAATYYDDWVIGRGKKQLDPEDFKTITPPKQVDPNKVYAMPATGSMQLGNPHAKVVIVEASDYACPYCNKVAPTIRALWGKYGEKVRIVQRPIIVHTIAFAAGAGACAAARQGQRELDRFDQAMWKKAFPKGFDVVVAAEDTAFDPMIKKPDGSYPCWTTTEGCPVVLGVAQQVGLDIARFKKDLSSCGDEVGTASADWKRFDVTGIPAFFINGRPLSGAQPIEELTTVIDEELVKVDQRLAASGKSVDTYYEEWVIGKGLANLYGVAESPEVATPPDVAKPPPDAKRTAKGVFYKILRAGNGAAPTPTSTVLLHYTGWTTNGKQFDSSRKSGKPVEMPLNAVIPGFADGILAMVVGDRARIWIPQELAYHGQAGAPVGMLVFDLELVSIITK